MREREKSKVSIKRYQAHATNSKTWLVKFVGGSISSRTSVYVLSGSPPPVGKSCPSLRGNRGGQAGRVAQAL